MRHFLTFIGVIFFIMFSYGFISPLLISYPDTMVVLGGMLYAAVIAPVVVWYIIGSYVKALINKVKGE
jgi:hypothetical protein